MVGEHELKRRYPRIPSENALLLKRRGGEEDEGFAKTRVVGLGGCMFVSGEALGVGTRLEILMSVRGRVAKTDGRVVYEVPRETRCFEVGVEFLGISPPDRHVLETLFAP
jgi:hypothetical protein